MPGSVELSHLDPADGDVLVMRVPCQARRLGQKMCYSVEAVAAVAVAAAAAAAAAAAGGGGADLADSHPVQQDCLGATMGLTFGMEVDGLVVRQALVVYSVQSIVEAICALSAAVAGCR